MTILKVGKDLVLKVKAAVYAGTMDAKTALATIFPKNCPLPIVFPKLMIKKVNKDGSKNGRIVLWKSSNNGTVVHAGNGKYPMGYSGPKLKIDFGYEDYVCKS